jgi:DnaJ-class molecular chaperone
MRDPYEVLGVPKSASAHDIKSAFRRLAKKHHPDANTKDPKAQARFAEINGAHEILSDPDKRKQFDRGEIDAEGKPRFTGFPGGGFPGGGAGGPNGFPGGSRFESFSFGPDGMKRESGGRGFAGFEDILSGMFGGRGPRGFTPEEFGLEAGADAVGSVSVTATEARTGTRRRVRLSNGREVEIAVPAGIGDGKTIRLRGQGFASSAGGPPGDALVSVTVALPAGLSADGATLRADVPVTLYDAVLGGKVRVPTLDGAVDLTVPAGTTGAKSFRLKGKGLPGPDGVAGDLIVALRIVLPGRSDADLEALMRVWKDKAPYSAT